jgi:glycosyltransferase involved in cell wall biosynthesis
LLAESLDSALSQTVNPLEVLVIDDGSDDGTAEFVHARAHPAIRYFGFPHSGRVSKLRNLGIESARGECIAFLDSDDLWTPNTLESLLSGLQAHPNAGFAYCGFRTFDEAGNSKIHVYRTGAGPERSVQNIFAGMLAGAMGPYPSGLLMRRSAVERIGRLDEELMLGEYEFICRLAYEFPAVIVHEPLVRIRKHPGNSSWRLQAEELREAIIAVEKSYRARKIPIGVFQDRIVTYRAELARVFLSAGDAAEAGKQLRGCLSALGQPA